MINRVKNFLFQRNGVAGEGKKHTGDEKALAAAALLVEAARLDHSFDGVEREAIESALRRKFGLDDEECATLIEEASVAQEDSNQLFGFTLAVKQNFTQEERIELIEMLWEVVYADGELHHYEANLLRRIGGLIYVSDRDRGLARKRVIDRLGLVED